MNGEGMKRSILILIALVILVAIGLTSYFALRSSNILVPTYAVHVTEKGQLVQILGNGTALYKYCALLVVFTQNNETKTITKCYLGENGNFPLDPVANVTLPEGPYVVEVYHADSGISMEGVIIYVANETSFSLGPFS
jgi:hypothetical protein